MSAPESGEQTRSALDRAVAAGLDSPELSMLEGAYQFYVERDWVAARERLDEAIARNADLAHAYLLRSLLRATLREGGALDDIAVGRRLDPLNPAIMLARAMCLAGEGRYADAEAETGLIRDIAPSFRPALELRADLAWIRGEDSAVSWERRNWQGDPQAAMILGEPAAGADVLAAVADLFDRRSRNAYVSPRIIARLRSLSGQHEAALDILERAAGQGDLMQVDFLALAPAFDAIRQHARFRDLARSLGLPA